MGWEVLITAELRGNDPIETVALVRDAFEAAPSVGPLFSVKIKDSDYLEGATVALRKEEGAISRAELEALRDKNGMVPGAEGWWEANRFLAPPGDENGEPEPWTYRVCLHTLSDDYRWPAVARNSAPAVLDAGDYKDFAPSIRREAARRNLEALVDECAALVAAGAQRLRGLDAERDADPRRAWLVFHADPEGFRADLRHAEMPAPALDADSIADAVLEEETVGLRETPAGLIVYAKRGPTGSLERFYEALSRSHS